MPDEIAKETPNPRSPADQRRDTRSSSTSTSRPMRWLGKSLGTSDQHAIRLRRRARRGREPQDGSRADGSQWHSQ
jgi:hypothetical protein